MDDPSISTHAQQTAADVINRHNENDGYQQTTLPMIAQRRSNNYLLLSSILAIAFVLVVVIYHGLTCRGKVNQSQSASKLDMWFFSHVLLYAILGWLFPDEWVLLIGIGVAWEVLEWVVHRLSNSLSASTPGYRFIQCKNSQEPLLYEKWTDLIANLIGLLIGAGAAWVWSGQEY